MSNSRAIAAVTAALRNLLFERINVPSAVDPNSDPHLAGTQVTTRPPDRARNNTSGNQLNLFLYQTVPNVAWRNMDMPRQVHDGEASSPPLPLNLHYLITAYCDEDDTDGIRSHQLLGRAMSILHDHCLLGRDEVGGALPDSGLGEQFERLRITPQALSLQEMFNLWSTFQTQYRVSAAYEVTVVLIESTRAPRAPLPVLRRGAEDRGAFVEATPLPTLTGVRATWQLRVEPPAVLPFSEVLAPAGQTVARLGETLAIQGQNLTGEGTTVRFRHVSVPTAVELEPQGEGTATELKVRLLSAGPSRPWAPGLYRVSLIVSRPGLPDCMTNEVPFTLAPAIAVAPLTASPGDLALTVTCAPRLRERQPVSLLFGDRQFAPDTVTTPDDDPAQPTTLTFNVPAVSAGTYLVRLRVDGVDSLCLARAGTGLPPAFVFDPLQQVEVQ